VPAPDIILVNGRIHTMDARNTIVSTVTVRDGRFAAVGNTAPRNPPAGLQLIDVRGRTVVPGLIDTHLHGLDTADRVGYHALDVESAGTIRGVQEVLAGHRKTVPEGQWITAIGAANTNLWAEHRMPTLKELDDAVPDRPVLLYQGFNGVGATNTLGKRFFDAADAAPPLHPDYIKVNVSDTGAIGASTAKGGPSTSTLYLLRPEVALHQARASEARWLRGAPLGPLDGVPVTIKENITTEGDPTPLGTAATRLTPSDDDATEYQ
jgi:predicted amidohydrolase YtcJ